MFICRLFHHDRPFEQIEARLIAEGQTTVGRDPAADWSLTDPQGVLSRIHCTLSVEDGRLFLTDTSTNGTFLEGGARAPAHEPVELRARQSIRLGDLSILVDQPQGAAADATTLHGGLDLTPTPVPRDWSDPQPATRPHRDGSLIEAFCEGAGLDASSLSGQEPHELMTRIGAIYQQTVLGLATLMADRARVKSEAQLDRTTLGAQANNRSNGRPPAGSPRTCCAGRRPASWPTQRRCAPRSRTWAATWPPWPRAPMRRPIWPSRPWRRRSSTPRPAARGAC